MGTSRIFKVAAAFLCIAFLGEDAQGSCDQAQFASMRLEANYKVIVVQNRIELNDYVSRADAFREAQLEAISIAAYCASIALSADQATHMCDVSTQNGVEASYVIENYSLNSKVVCGEAGWLYVRSEIKFL